MSGHCLAGGFLLAAHCDGRIAAQGSYRIGLKEMVLGIELPVAARDRLHDLWPPAVIARILQGELFVPEQALELGLIDYQTPADSLLLQALNQVKERAARGRPTGGPKHPPYDTFRLERSNAAFLDSWYSESTQTRLRAIVARLEGEKTPSTRY